VRIVITLVSCNRVDSTGHVSMRRTIAVIIARLAIKDFNWQTTQNVKVCVIHCSCLPHSQPVTIHKQYITQDGREWLLVFPFPPIPMGSFPFPFPFSVPWLILSDVHISMLRNCYLNFIEKLSYLLLQLSMEGNHLSLFNDLLRLPILHHYVWSEITVDM